jgi:hypothetical protein
LCALLHVPESFVECKGNIEVEGNCGEGESSINTPWLVTKTERAETHKKSPLLRR